MNSDKPSEETTPQAERSVLKQPPKCEIHGLPRYWHPLQYVWLCAECERAVAPVETPHSDGIGGKCPGCEDCRPAKLAENLKEELGESLREAAALRERERWIPGSERMPEDGVEVLIYVAREVKSAHRVLVGSGRTEIRKWDAGDPNHYETEKAVTHWKALSAAPEPEAKS